MGRRKGGGGSGERLREGRKNAAAIGLCQSKFCLVIHSVDPSFSSSFISFFRGCIPSLILQFILTSLTLILFLSHFSPVDGCRWSPFVPFYRVIGVLFLLLFLLFHFLLRFCPFILELANILCAAYLIRRSVIIVRYSVIRLGRSVILSFLFDEQFRARFR